MEHLQADPVREALASLIEVYDAMGAPRGPARIMAEAALAGAAPGVPQAVVQPLQEMQGLGHQAARATEELLREPDAQWVITSPDGQKWAGANPLRACAAAQRDTVDPVLAMRRINAMVEEEDALHDAEWAPAISALDDAWRALTLAMTLCDAVPTRWHMSEDETQAFIGRMVNAQPGGGSHGYAFIRDTLAKVEAFLKTVPAKIGGHDCIAPSAAEAKPVTESASRDIRPDKKEPESQVAALQADQPGPYRMLQWSTDDAERVVVLINGKRYENDEAINLHAELGRILATPTLGERPELPADALGASFGSPQVRGATASPSRSTFQPPAGASTSIVGAGPSLDDA